MREILRKGRVRAIISVLLSALMLLGATATAANAAIHWHRVHQPSHIDKRGVWLGTPFPFTIDFRYQVGTGCLHTDVIKYTEWVTGANDFHNLRHSTC